MSDHLFDIPEKAAIGGMGAPLVPIEKNRKVKERIHNGQLTS